MQLKLEKGQGTRVIILRHGQSTFNALGLYQGSSDESVLTELGRDDARKTGYFFKGLTFDAIYISSLKRAQETAKEILEVITSRINSKAIFVTDNLRENDLPAWQGLAFQYVRETLSDAYRLWKQRPHEFWMQVDSQTRFYPALNLYERVQQFWQEVLPRHIGQTLLVVAHGGTNRALISTALGITPDRYHCIQQSNCGVSILNFPDGSLNSGQLEAMNLSSHIGEYLPNLQEGGKGLRLLLVAATTTALQAQNLAAFLKEIQINFSLTDVFHTSQQISEYILQDHLETFKIQVCVNDFSINWQKLIDNKLDFFETNTTVLIVGNEQNIKFLIAQVLNANLKRLQMKPGTISCIHYPGFNHLPVLQGLNISDIGKYHAEPQRV
jgi:phosphoserine phosphatase